VAAAPPPRTVAAEQVDVISDVVKPVNLARAADQDVDLAGLDEALADIAATRSHEVLTRSVERYLKRLDQDGPEPDPTEGRRLTISKHADGSISFRCGLDEVGGEKVQAALESLVQADRPAGDERSRAQRLGDALVQLADIQLGCGGLPLLRTVKPHVAMTIELADALDPARGPAAAELGFGGLLSAERARWVACDAEVTRIVLDPDGLPLDVGRTQRLVPPHLRKAVEHRDTHCVFAGCDAPTHWCEVHHLLAWLLGGATSLDNSALLCERHHTQGPPRLPHRPRYRRPMAHLPPRRHRDPRRCRFLRRAQHGRPVRLASSVVPIQQPADLEGVRRSYDAVADNYVAMGAGELGPHPWLRAVLAAFAEEVRDLGPVLDVGCGPGFVTAHLAGLGVDVSGVDLSPRMVEHARRLHPGLRFEVGSSTELCLDEASLGGVLGWWSLFNLPREVLPGVLASFAGALLPGGQALIGTHVGDGEFVRTEGYGGVPVTWTTHLWRPEELAALITEAGLEMVAELRFPATEQARPQVVIAARRPSSDPAFRAIARAVPKHPGRENAGPMAQPIAQKSVAIPLTAFAVGAVIAILVGVIGRLHDPTLSGTTTLGFRTVLEMKVAVSIAIAPLLLLQLLGGLWMYGKLGGSAPSWVGPAHRGIGTVALVLSVFVAYHCLWALGLEVGHLPDGEAVSTRTVVHGLIGCLVIGTIVVKLVAVRSRRAPGWFLPVAGGLLFTLLVLAVLTSAVFYIAAEGWPSGAE
jgi:SAM-dependent methyltransferase